MSEGWNANPFSVTPIHSPLSALIKVDASAARKNFPQCPIRWSSSTVATPPATASAATAKAQRRDQNGGGAVASGGVSSSCSRASSYRSLSSVGPGGTLIGRYHAVGVRARLAVLNRSDHFRYAA